MDFFRVKREIGLGLAILLMIATAAYADNVLEVETERETGSEHGNRGF